MCSHQTPPDARGLMAFLRWPGIFMTGRSMGFPAKDRRERGERGRSRRNKNREKDGEKENNGEMRGEMETKRKSE